MRFVNIYQDLTNESFFDAIGIVGYRTVTDFCNDNLDCIDYDVSIWSWNSAVISNVYILVVELELWLRDLLSCKEKTLYPVYILCNTTVQIYFKV